MTLRLLIGLLGSALLVSGAALPNRPASHPALSRKNQLFAAGNAGMCLYALLGYLQGGSVFFLALQMLVALSTVCMLTSAFDRVDTWLVGSVGALLAVWALWYGRDASAALFALGLTVLGVGFASRLGTRRREALLLSGSVVIALFSTLERDWVFVGLNVLFALFAGLNLRRISGD